MLKATLLTVFTILAFVVQAQFAVGPKVNLGMTMYRPNDIAQDFRKGRIGFSYSAGVQVDWRFGNLGIQPEILFSQRSIVSEIADAPLTSGDLLDVQSKIKANSIDIPLLLKYYLRGKDFGGYFIAGPQVNFNIGGTITEDVFVNDAFSANDSYSRDLNIGVSNSDFYKGSDFGFTFGGGVFINMLTGKLNLDVRYRLGTTEQYTSGDFYLGERANFKTSDFMVSAGYVFSLGGKW